MLACLLAYLLAALTPYDGRLIIKSVEPEPLQHAHVAKHTPVMNSKKKQRVTRKIHPDESCGTHTTEPEGEGGTLRVFDPDHHFV